MDYIVGLGEALFDCLPTGRKLGGAPANFAYHVSQFGLHGCAISAIGNDDFGREIEDTFQQVGLDFVLPHVDAPTGMVKVTLSADGIPQYDICQGVAWDNIPFTSDLAVIAQQTKAVCFGSLAQRSSVSRSTIQRFLDAMPANSMRVFDINLRQNWYSKEIIEQSLSRSTVLKLNDEELAVVAPMLLDIHDEVASLFNDAPMLIRKICHRILQKYNLQTLILTCGAVGSYVFATTEDSYFPTPHVDVVDTVGAGDSFTAAYVACTLMGLPLKAAHQKAVEVSAFVCTQAGAMPKLPL